MRLETRKRAGGTAGALAAMPLLATPAVSFAQCAGKGGIGVDEVTQILRCDRPLGVVGGGLLLDLDVGAWGGGYTGTGIGIGKVTTIAVHDAFRKLAADARSRLTPPAAGAAAGAGSTPVPTPASGTRP